MPSANTSGSHVAASDKAGAALVLIDVINDFRFEGGAEMVPRALEAAERAAALKRRLKAQGCPTIYANDNFGRWQEDFSRAIERCTEPDAPGREVVERLRPKDDDYFVLKPKHSAFYATTLTPLLEHLGVGTVILAGFAGDICVLATAIDAYMRDFHVVVPSDCSASEDPDENAHALAYARRVLDADTTPSDQLDLESWGACSTAEAR